MNGKSSQGSCIMKILFYEVRYFSPNFHEFTGSKTIFAKKKILAQKLEKKKLSKSVSGYYKKKKKWHGPLSHWCREGKTLVSRPLKKKLFLCVSSLRREEEKTINMCVVCLHMCYWKPHQGLTQKRKIKANIYILDENYEFMIFYF